MNAAAFATINPFRSLSAARARLLDAHRAEAAAWDRCTCPGNSRRCTCAAAPMIKAAAVTVENAAQEAADLHASWVAYNEIRAGR